MNKSGANKSAAARGGLVAAAYPNEAEWESDLAAQRRSWIAVCIASVSGFLFVVDAGFIALALPQIEAEFSSSPRSSVAWVATAFMVAQSSLLLIGGRLGDRRGRKRFYLIGLLLFSFGAVCTALAPTLPLLIAARAVQGAGAALLTSGALALVLPLFPISRSPTVIGLWGMVGSIAGWLTPLAGPALVNIDWRLAFASVAPVGLAAYLVGARTLPEFGGDESAGPTDRIGLVIGPPALGLTVLVLSRGGKWGWASPMTLVLAVVAAGLLAAFVRRSLVAPEPLLDLSLVRNHVYTNNILAGFLQQAAFFGWFLTAPLIMTSIWGWSLSQVGLALALSQVPASIGAPLAGRLVGRYSATSLSVFGTLIAASGTLWWGLIATDNVDIWFGFLPGALLLGFGESVCGTLVSGAALASLDARFLGAGNSLQQLVRRLGGAAGVAVCIAVLGEADGVELLGGARRVWMMTAAFHLAMLVPLLRAREHRPQ